MFNLQLGLTGLLPFYGIGVFKGSYVPSTHSTILSAFTDV